MQSVQNLQQKPRHVRQRILFITVGLAMAVVITSWLMVTSRRIDADILKAGNTPAEMDSADSPFGTLKRTFTDIAKDIRTQF